jgi:hypothetical protein
VRSLLTRWRNGQAAPADVARAAQEIWLSRGWPKVGAEDSRAIPLEVLFMLSLGRQSGLTHEDIPALLEYLATPDGEALDGRARWFAYLESLNLTERDPVAAGDYWGPASPDDEQLDMELGISDPSERRLHLAIREDPESAWEDLRALLCSAERDDLFVIDLVEDLLSLHGDAFIDRLEAVAAECADALEIIALADVGGFAGPAMERFLRLQARARPHLERRGWTLK